MVQPSLLNEVMMRLDTAKGGEVRRHFIKIKELLDVYMMYQAVHRHMSWEFERQSLLSELKASTIALTQSGEELKQTRGRLEDAAAKAEQLASTNERLATANETLSSTNEQLADEVKQAREGLEDTTAELHDLRTAIEEKQPLLVHDATHPSHTYHMSIYANDTVPTKVKYKVIRCQAASLARSVASVRRDGYRRCVLELENIQGPVNSWNKIRVEFARAKFTGLTCTLDGATEAEFIEAVKGIEKARSDV
jgi:uncharacterized coiled-coil DUF342 family protein